MSLSFHQTSDNLREIRPEAHSFPPNFHKVQNRKSSGLNPKFIDPLVWNQPTTSSSDFHHSYFKFKNQNFDFSKNLTFFRSKLFQNSIVESFRWLRPQFFNPTVLFVCLLRRTLMAEAIHARAEQAHSMVLLCHVRSVKLPSSLWSCLPFTSRSINPLNSIPLALFECASSRCHFPTGLALFAARFWFWRKS